MRLPALLLLGIIALGVFLEFTEVDDINEKVTGVCLEAPRDSINAEFLEPIRLVNAQWVSIIPYAFINPADGEVKFSFNQRWWGEGVNGSTETIKMSKELGFKVMLKPHVWVRGQGWAGDLEFTNLNSQKKWEDSYRKYILEYARVAETTGVEILCIGTEFRKLVISNPDYWSQLIQEVRKVYSGKVTYAANWDNYNNISFWPMLDYIGIDAYFPASEQKTPEVEETAKKLNSVRLDLKLLSNNYNKKILFTEYGFQSIDYTAMGHWKINKDTLSVNLEAQANSYQAFYTSLWYEPWCAGGFLWKWHVEHDKYGGANCKRYTPQNKPSQVIIAAQYKKTLTN